MAIRLRRGTHSALTHATDPADTALLDRLQRTAYDYFARSTNAVNGLVPDRLREGSPSSIAAVGLALSAHPVAVERGWARRETAVRLTLAALRFFWQSDQSGSPEATGFKGYYFHFLDLSTGQRTWHCELSIIDTALLMAGVLTAAAYFTGADAAETELRELAEALYRRVDWRWAERPGGAVVLGWLPEHGFLDYGWEGYNEALILYVLGLGSPTHPLSAASYSAWTMTYQWENLYGQDVLHAGPLFIHQLSHAWLDLRGVRDAFMREKHCDYFENSRRATVVQREYARRNPLDFRGYGADRWGLSAGEGPSRAPLALAGRYQPFYGYAARGVPYGPTTAPSPAPPPSPACRSRPSSCCRSCAACVPVRRTRTQANVALPLCLTPSGGGPCAAGPWGRHSTPLSPVASTRRCRARPKGNRGCRPARSASTRA